MVACVNRKLRALEVLPSLHDNLLISYQVDCESRTIRIRARRPKWPNRFDQDRVIVFSGVEAYQFQNDAFGNIIHALERIPLEEFISRFGSEIEKSYNTAGAPGPWAADVAEASAVLSARQVQGFILSSSYGLSGRVLARDVSIERDTPLRSEVIACVLPLLHDWRSGLNVQLMVGELISADTRLNIWAANVKREPNLTPEQWFETLDLHETLTAECKAAVNKFVGDGDRTTLLHTLNEIIRKLNHRPAFASIK